MRKALPVVLLFAHSATARCGDEWIHIAKGDLRLGVNKTAGACIGWFSRGERAPNLLNSHDRGRFLQQSYYGDEDGSLWNDKPWRYNPVQGGHWLGKPAKVLEISHDAASLYSKTQPVHWATGEVVAEMTMEQWVTLLNDFAHIRFRVSYTGTRSHVAHDQEIPAFFVQPFLDTLITYEGGRPWTNDTISRRQPGFPNERATLSEHWAAWVDAKDYGIGLYVPVAREATCYRYGAVRSASDACSYIAPLKRFALVPGLVFEYDAWLTIGSIDEIRSRFTALRQKRGDLDNAEPQNQSSR